MNLAYVYYIILTAAQYDEINTTGWSGQVGSDYMKARKGIVTDGNRQMMKLAATVDLDAIANQQLDDRETVWVAMQNHSTEWKNNPAITCHTSQPRSMDVGDFVELPDGTFHQCKSIGFEEVTSTTITGTLQMKRRQALLQD